MGYNNGKGIIMTKQEFMEQLIEELYHYFSPEQYQLEGSVLLKNNDTKRYAILLKKIQGTVSPTIYLDNFYSEFERGRTTISKTANHIYEQMHDFEDKVEAYQEFSAELSDCSDHITYRLVSKERNKQFLESVPHLCFLNLAIVFYIIHHVSEEGMESICVTNELAEKWGLNAKSLYAAASKNTPVLLPPVIDTMEHTIELLMKGISHTIDSTERNEELFPMHIMTNKYQINGASVLLYDGMLEGLADKLNSDLYVIPSSIHELIIMPSEDGALSLSKLSKMVKEINENHVKDEEILSDCAYYYNHKEKSFYM